MCKVTGLVKEKKEMLCSSSESQKIIRQKEKMRFEFFKHKKWALNQ